MVDDDETEIGGVFQHPAEDFGIAYWASVVGDGDASGILEFGHAGEFLTLEADGGRPDGMDAGTVGPRAAGGLKDLFRYRGVVVDRIGVRHAEDGSELRRARRS